MVVMGLKLPLGFTTTSSRPMPIVNVRLSVLSDPIQLSGTDSMSTVTLQL